MTKSEKAKLVIELLTRYFEAYLPMFEEYYSALYNYNEEENVQYYDYDWCEEFSIIVENDKYILDINSYRIDYIRKNRPDLNNLIKFNEVLEKCYVNKKVSWDYTIEYLQKRLGEKDKTNE